MWNSPANQLRIFKSQMEAAGRAIGQAFMPFIQAVLPWISTLAVVLERVGNALARFTFRLFGRDFDAEMKAQQDALKGMQDSAAGAGNAQDELGDKTEEGAKKAEGALTPYDRLNIIQKKQADSAGAGAGDGFDFAVPELPEPTGQSQFEKMANDLENSVKKAFDAIKGFWDEYFAKPFSDAWAKIKPEIDKISDTFRRIGGDIAALGEPLKKVFIESVVPMIQQIIDTSSTAFAGLLNSANMVISDVWDALYPLLEKFVTDGIPFISEFITELVITFGTLFNEAKTIFDMLWKDVVKPALDLISGIFLDVMQMIKDAWDKWGKTTFDNIREAITTTSELFQTLWSDFLKPIFDSIFEALGKLWTEHLQPLIEQIAEFVLTFINAALDIYNEFIAPIVEWFLETFGPTIAEVIVTAITVIGTFVGAVLDVATGVLKALGGLMEFIAGVFTGDWGRAWEGIKTMFGGVWDGIVGIARGAWEAITGFLEGIYKTAVKVIEKIKEVLGYNEETRYSNAPSQMGRMSSSSGSGRSLAPYTRTMPVPALAQGGVLRRSTLVNVAEYAGASSNPEIVSPQNIMYETVVEALAPLAAAIARSGDKTAEKIVKAIAQNALEADESGMFQIVQRKNAQYREMTGTPAF